MSDFTDNLENNTIVLTNRKDPAGSALSRNEGLELKTWMPDNYQDNWLFHSGVPLEKVLKQKAGTAAISEPQVGPVEMSGDGGGRGGMQVLSPAAGPKKEPIVAPTMPQLPKLDLSKGSSTEYQLNRLLSLDSLPMQQARVNAFENGVASGSIHGSQQAGAAQRAVTETMQPIATAEASRIGNQDVQNWSTEVKQLTDVYEKEYAGYLSKLGYESNQKIAMTQANTSLSTSLLSSMTSLMNNPDIVFGEEVKNKLTSVFNSAMMNNNTILDMGFTYA